MAVESAARLIEMNPRERDMIENHMWPVTTARPKYAETYIITFVDKYCALLRSCGSGMVADVAGSVGINVRSVDFWRESLNVYVKEIDEFIALADELMK